MEREETDEEFMARYNELKLFLWLEKQRRNYIAGLLTPEQISQLEALPGFSWECELGPDLYIDSDTESDTTCVN